MKWAFWRRRAAEDSQKDPSTIGSTPLLLLMDRKPPFTGWEPPDLVVPEQDWIRPAVWNYQLYTYLKLVERRFGPEISPLVREHQIIIMNRGSETLGEWYREALGIFERGASAAESSDDTPEELRAAVRFLVMFRGSPYFLPPDERPAADNSSIQSEGIDFTLAQCFISARDLAVRAFAPVLDKLELTQVCTTSGLNIAFTSLPHLRPIVGPAWSSKPGCYELHLMRRHNNPLFPPASRGVTHQDLATARSRDALELWFFRRDLATLLDGIRDRRADTIAAREAIDFRRNRIDTLLVRAAELGLSADDEKASLLKLYESLTQCVSATLEDESFGLLQKAEQANKERWRIFNNPFIAQCHRKDSPMHRYNNDEYVAAILSEDPETISLYMEFVNENQELCRGLTDTARNIIHRAEQEGARIEQKQEKLLALGLEPI